MNNFEKKLRNAAKEKYSLSADERAQMKEHVEQYMGIKPIRRREDFQHAFSSFFIAIQRTGAVVAVFAIIFVMGGLSAAANNALPGDALYPIKHILEDARSSLSTSLESKAEWEVRRLERRIDEAALLEGMGALDSEQRERIDEAIDEHAERVSEFAARLEVEDDIAASNLRTNVAIELESKEGENANTTTFSAFSAQDEVMESALVPQTAKIIVDTKEVSDGDIEYEEAATKQRTKVREIIRRVERQRAYITIGLHAEDFELNILTPLASLRADMKKVDTLFEDGKFKEAHDLLIEIHKQVRSLDLALKSGSWRSDDEVVDDPEDSAPIEERESDFDVDVDVSSDLDVIE